MSLNDYLSWTEKESDRPRVFFKPEALRGIHILEPSHPRTGNRDLAICPSDVFQCKDGLVALATGSDEEFQCLCQAMERPELAENEHFASLLNRVKKKNTRALLKIIREWVKVKTVAEVDQLGAQFGFACIPILYAEDRYESEW